MNTLRGLSFQQKGFQILRILLSASRFGAESEDFATKLIIWRYRKDWWCGQEGHSGTMKSGASGKNPSQFAAQAPPSGCVLRQSCGGEVDQWISCYREEIVDRYTCRTPPFHMHSHCTVETTCVPWLKGLESSRRIVCQNFHTSTRHVSPCASQYTEHKHKFSPNYLSSVTDVIFSEPRPVVHASIYSLQRSTARWHFYGIQLLHRFSSLRGSSSSGFWSIHKVE